jgi:pyrimidine deaminase RibD-like protein
VDDAPDDGGAALAPGLPAADRHWLAQAIELSRQCKPSDSAFCVGAVLVTSAGQPIATGYSRQSDPREHAEEAALSHASSLYAYPGDADLSGATLYSSLEPCLTRVSRPVSCARLILRSGIRRVVIAWREPPVFQPGGGAPWLIDHGVTVIELPDLAPAARAINRWLLPDP